MSEPKPRKVWTCDQCGKKGVWDDNCFWRPKLQTLADRKRADPEPEYIVCSEECRQASPHAAAPVLK